MSGRTRKTKVTAMIAYVYPQKTRLNPIAETMDFEIMIGIGEVRVGVSGSKGWIEPAQPSFKYLWSWDFKEKRLPHFLHKVSILTKFAFISSKFLSEY